MAHAERSSVPHVQYGSISGDVAALGRAIRSSRQHLLLVFVPIAVVLELLEASPTWQFIASALAVVPLAGLIGRATEELSEHVGPGIGGLLNATFGNGAELLIGGLALQRGLIDVVKASLSGSIIGNLLLVLGFAIVVGGWGRDVQRFNAVSATSQTTMMFLAVVALVMPAVYERTVDASAAAAGALNALSLLSALVLLAAYAAGLVFSLRTHRDVFRGDAADTPQEQQPPLLSTRAAVMLLAVATALTAVSAEILVGSVEQFSHSIGLTDLFVGMILVAIVGNAAEHWSAVMIARGGNMQLAVNIAKQSSVQIALMVAPLLILLSWGLGQPMTLLFHPFELFGIALAVGAAGLVSMDGETHWYEGALLLAVYALLTISIYYLPA